MELLTVNAVVRCGHDGRVENVARQGYVTIGSVPVLVAHDPRGRTVVGCPNVGPTMKPCTTTLAVDTGYSGWIRIDGNPVVLSTLDGLTDGTVPGTVHYTVRDPGQDFVRADG
jgi:hypothetical protein